MPNFKNDMSRAQLDFETELVEIKKRVEANREKLIKLEQAKSDSTLVTVVLITLITYMFAAIIYIIA